MTTQSCCLQSSELGVWKQSILKDLLCLHLEYVFLFRISSLAGILSPFSGNSTLFFLWPHVCTILAHSLLCPLGLCRGSLVSYSIISTCACVLEGGCVCVPFSVVIQCLDFALGNCRSSTEFLLNYFK